MDLIIYVMCCLFTHIQNSHLNWKLNDLLVCVRACVCMRVCFRVCTHTAVVK